MNINELSLPELTGSEKQVKWATSIRNKCLEKVFNNMEKAAKNNYYQKDINSHIVKKAIKMALDKQNSRIKEILRRTDAKWWIDNRDIENPSLTTFYDMEVWGATWDGFHVAEADTYIMLDFKTFVKYYKKALQKLEAAIETGEKQRILRYTTLGYRVEFYISPNGEITREKMAD